ncbi:MAG TPA: RNA polymerase sigma factor [Steroidobacteraceae bacterium]|nr:RNA polymerase sigma factor [Steroidobacteraceae bacterium]
MTLTAPDLRLAAVAESAVIAMAVAGDQPAFVELIRRRQHGVRRFMRQLCRDQALADDLAQQVFLRMWRSLRQLAALERFNGWLKQVMVSVWLDEMRLRRGRIEAATAANREQASARQSPGLERDLEYALAQLEPRTRLCVVLAYSEGHSHAEISVMLAIPLGTAKSLVIRGAHELRALLRDYAFDLNSSGALP